MVHDAAWCLQDVVYYFAPRQTAQVNISLCLSAEQATPFDTKLYVFSGLGSSQPTPVPVACNDDFCGYLSSVSVSPCVPKACMPGVPMACSPPVALLVRWCAHEPVPHSPLSFRAASCEHNGAPDCRLHVESDVLFSPLDRPHLHQPAGCRVAPRVAAHARHMHVSQTQASILGRDWAEIAHCWAAHAG